MEEQQDKEKEDHAEDETESCETGNLYLSSFIKHGWLMKDSP